MIWKLLRHHWINPLMDEPHPRKCKARISIDDRPAYQVNVHSAVNSWVFEEFSLLLSLYTLSLSLFFCPPLVLCFFAHFSDLRRCLMNIIKRNHQQLGWINLAMAFWKWQEELRWSWVIDRRHTSSAVRLSKIFVVSLHEEFIAGHGTGISFAVWQYRCTRGADGQRVTSTVVGWAGHGSDGGDVIMFTTRSMISFKQSDGWKYGFRSNIEPLGVTCSLRISLTNTWAHSATSRHSSGLIKHCNFVKIFLTMYSVI